MTIRADIGGPQLAVANGSATVRLRWYNEAAAAYVVPVSGTVTAYDGDTLVDSANITVSGNYAVAVLDLSSLTPGIGENGAYGLEWAVTLTGSVAVTAWQGLACLAVSSDCPVTTAAILRRHPTLTDYPPGQTSWGPQIEAAWETVTRALISATPAVRWGLWNPDALYEPTILLALSYIFRQADTFLPGAGFGGQADAYYQKWRDAWAEMALTFDTDGDGIPEEAGVRSDRPSFPPPRGVRRG